eukprot:249116-Amphidinium_carterae.1
MQIKTPHPDKHETKEQEGARSRSPVQGRHAARNAEVDRALDILTKEAERLRPPPKATLPDTPDSPVSTIPGEPVVAAAPMET